jgi:hypothetical protein
MDVSEISDRVSQVAEQGLHDVIDAYQQAHPGEPLDAIQQLLPKIHQVIAAAYQKGLTEGVEGLSSPRVV